MPRRYLVFALQGLGDALEATPLIAGLAASDVSATIDVAVSRGAPAALFAGLPHLVRRVVCIPFWERGAVAAAVATVRAALSERYDASFLAYPAAKAVYHALAAAFPARRRFAHRYATPSIGNFLWTYGRLVPIRAAHNVERNLDLLRAAGFDPPHVPHYLAPDDWFASTRDSRVVTVHVGTIAHDGFENKRWPVEKFAAVGELLQRRGYEIAILGGPEERLETERIARMLPAAHVVTGSLREAARHLSRSALVITNDSGIGHLAAAVRAPVVSLFGPTPTLGAPYGTTSHPLRASECPPCFDPLARGISCVRDIDFRCIRADLTVERVMAHVDRLLTEVPCVAE